MKSLDENLTFEEALSQLEDLVSALEQGQKTLEEAVETYEKGVALKAFCMEKLKAAQVRIEKVSELQNKISESS